MKKFSFRAESFSDVQQLFLLEEFWCKICSINIFPQRLEGAGRNGENVMIPDVECQVSSPYLTLTDMVKIMKTVDDGDAMWQSVNVTECYTGKRFRDYDDDDENEDEDENAKKQKIIE